MILTFASSLVQVGFGQVEEKRASSDFNLVFKYGMMAQNMLDTFKGTYTKDMIANPDTTVALSLTQGDMDSIYRKMIEIDFFSYPDSFVPNPKVFIQTKEHFYPDSSEFGHGFGLLYGGIKDKETGLGIDSVIVEIECPNAEILEIRRGYYSVRLPVGMYSVFFSKAGYVDLKLKRVPVKSSFGTISNVELEPIAGVTEKGMVDTVHEQTFEPLIIPLVSSHTPYSTYVFEVQTGEKVKQIRWDDDTTTEDPRAIQLKELVQLIRAIVESKPEYKALPMPRGGYM